MAIEKSKEKVSMTNDTSVDYYDNLTMTGANKKVSPSSPDDNKTVVTLKKGNDVDGREDASGSFPSPFRHRLVIALMVCITVIMLFFINANILRAHMTKMTMERNWYLLKEAPCSQPEMRLQKMSTFAADASAALIILGSNPVACYGTLLGALRRGNVLPWDNNIDLCVVNRISKDFKEIREAFSIFNIVIHPYDKWYGRYYIHRYDNEGFITVFSQCTILDDLVFTKERNLIQEDFTTEIDAQSTLQEVEDPDFRLCPDGTLPYITQILHGDTKPIPSVLLRAPFSSLPFGKNTSIAIPHGDVEILKYFYPNSWWIEIKPVGC